MHGNTFKDFFSRNWGFLIGWFLIVTVILVGVYYFIFVGKQTKEDQETTKQEELSKGDVIAKELIDKYQAVAGWEDSFTFTIEAQERLITEKPVLFRGYIDDVFKRDGKTFVRLSSSLLSLSNYVAELECSQQIVDEILAHKSNNKDYLRFLEEYAVVANIQEFTKPVFALRGSAISEDEAEISIGSSDLFIARGTCVDVAYIGSDGL